MVAGCPPDGFAPDGQLWGNPIYDWARMEEDGFVYECVFPVRNGEFECRYEPREEHKDALRVISIKTV